MRTLRSEYLASIPEKIAQLERQAHAADVASLSDSFHKLKGTGATYGLPEVSVLAEVAEDICVQLPARALKAASLAIPILRDIYSARQTQVPYAFEQDPRLLDLRKLLQN